MLSPDRGLTGPQNVTPFREFPVALNNVNIDTEKPGLNAFQMRLFLHFHKAYDDFVYLSAIRSRTYHQSSSLREMDVEGLKTSAINAIEFNDAQIVGSQAAPLLALSFNNYEECGELVESLIRGAMDIDKETYRTIRDYFERYSLNLRLYDDSQPISTNDQRFVSHRPEYIKFQLELFGSSLILNGYPDAESYNDRNFLPFIRNAKMRIEKVMEEMTHDKT